MKIKHINGERFYYAFFFGKKEVLRKREHLNRINVFLVSYTPPYGGSYYPSIGEVVVTIGFVSALFFVYRLGVTHFPILAAEKKEAGI